MLCCGSTGSDRSDRLFRRSGKLSNFLPNSYCNTSTMFCECLMDFVVTADTWSCEYDCGTFTNPDNGTVTTFNGTIQGVVAEYNCNNTYKLKGTATRTCVQNSGWDGVQPRCEPAEIGDDCSANNFQCNNKANGQCQQFSTCQCNTGYEDDGTGFACSDIDECVGNTCQHGATCDDGINEYTCTCVAGYEGDMCQNNITEFETHNCQHDDGIVTSVGTFKFFYILQFLSYIICGYI